MWSRLAICDLGRVLTGRTMKGTSQPYAWLLCLFMRATRGRHVWHKCVTAAMGPANNNFRYTTYLTRSDEAFIILVLEAKGRQWSAKLEDTKTAAWAKLKASIGCKDSNNTVVICVHHVSLTYVLFACCDVLSTNLGLTMDRLHSNLRTLQTLFQCKT